MWRRRSGLGARLLRGLLGLTLLLTLGVVGVRALITQAATPVLRTVSVGPFPAQVVVDAHTGRVFVANSHGSVSMLDAGSGRLLRTIPMTSDLGNIVVDGPTDRVFALSDSGMLAGPITMLDGRTGTVLGTTPASLLDPIVDPHTGTLYASAQDPQTGQYDRLDLVEGRRGTVRRLVLLNGLTPQVLGLDPLTQHLFAADFASGTARMLDATTGRLLHTVPLGPTPLGVAVAERTRRVFISNNGADTVSVLDARLGTLLRTIKVGPHPARAVVDPRTNRVFVVHGRGGASGPPYNFPDLEQSGVTMLDARTGAVLRSLPIGGSPVDDVQSATATNIAVDARRGRVFVLNQAALDANGLPVNGIGSVSVLDARSGAVLRTIAVGWDPLALVVDETRGRLFVLNENGGCIPGTTPFGWIPSGVRRWLAFLPAPGKPQCGLPGSVTVIDTARL